VHHRRRSRRAVHDRHPRGGTELTFDGVANTNRYFRLAAATTRLPAVPAQGLSATASTIHAAFSDFDQATGFIPQIKYRKSTNGGLTWGAEGVIHNVGATEVLPTNGLQIFAEDRNVVVVFRSDALTPGHIGVIGYSSNDQGQTWHGPTLLTPAFGGAAPTLTHDGSNPSTAEFRCVYDAKTLKLHVHYEALYTVTTAPTNNEECFYSRASVDAQGKLVVEKADVPVSNLPSPNQSDIDNVEIACDGQVVVLLYQDQGALSNNYNNTYVRISRDGGDNWAAPYAITSFDANSHPTHPSTDGDSNVAVSGPAIIVTTCDHRDQGAHGRYDEVFADVSYDAGLTWQPTVLISSTTANTDIDDNFIAAQGGKFVISWYEDLGLGNGANQNFVMVGNAAQIANGTATTTNVSAVAGIADHQLVEDVRLNDGGRLILLTGEAYGSINGGSEASVMSWSSDGGQTWQTSFGSDGSADVDDPSGVLTLNGDAMMIYDEETAGPNAVVVTGAKVPMLVNNTASQGGFELQGATRSANQVGLMLISGTAPVGNGFSLLGDGSPLRFSLDGLSILGLEFPVFFLQSIDANGVGKFPSVPDLKAITGSAWYATVVTIDIATTGLIEFPDTLKVD
jgi:hypothetical protein